MATTAQIEANRRNAQKSTGPKTERGKARAKLNAVTHGMTARTIIPVLPQEDPKELEDRIQQAITAMKPRNPLELDLVCRAVRLSGELDRAERVGTAHLAHRVRMDARLGTDRVSAEELCKVHDLGSKLFFQAAIGPGYSDSTADDYPAVIVRRLEESAEGCRWLLARWAELLNVVDREAAWGDPEIVRFVGLLGKRGIEAHFDPELNSRFHAFDALGHRIGHKFWNERRDGLPLGYIGGFEFVPYRQIAPPPNDKNAALVLICSVIERHVGRLEELLAEHEQIEAEEAAERYDRAALDCSPAFERHRRYQSARHRELIRTLETLRRMRNSECGTGNGEGEKADGKCQVADDRGQMADDGCRMADAGCKVRSGGCDDGESGETTPEVSQGPIVGLDSDRVIDDSTNDKIGILSHEGMDGMGNGQGGMADDGCRMADDGCKVRSGGCDDGECGETTPEVSQGPIVGLDSDRVIDDDSTNDKIGILSHEGTDATDRPYLGACDRQSLPSGVKMPENVQNEANPESTQSPLPLKVDSSVTEPAGQKRSQSGRENAPRPSDYWSRDSGFTRWTRGLTA